MQNPAQQLQNLGLSPWLDNITRAILRDGTLAQWCERYGLRGLTSNPSIFEKAIAGGDEYTTDIRASAGKDPESLFFDLAIDDLRGAAKLFEPVYRTTSGVDGHVSLEVSPLLADDTQATIEQAVTLHRRAGIDNLLIKVPGTPAGVPAIEELIYRGVPINVTLLFSPAQYRAAADAYLKGLERRAVESKPLNIASVASLFVSRWDAKVADAVPGELRNRLGLAVAGQTYADYHRMLISPRMQRLMNDGGRPQRLLWASTGTKDPGASDVLYVENLIAPLTINTLPDKTLAAYADHGEAGDALPVDGAAAAAMLQRFAERDLHVDALAAELQDEGKQAFVKSWHALLETIRKRTAQAA